MCTMLKISDQIYVLDINWLNIKSLRIYQKHLNNFKFILGLNKGKKFPIGLHFYLKFQSFSDNQALVFACKCKQATPLHILKEMRRGGDFKMSEDHLSLLLVTGPPNLVQTSSTTLLQAYQVQGEIICTSVAVQNQPTLLVAPSLIFVSPIEPTSRSYGDLTVGLLTYAIVLS